MPFTKKQFVKARYDGLQDAGMLTPKTVNLRIEELIDANGPEKILNKDKEHLNAGQPESRKSHGVET